MRILYVADGRSPTALNWISYFVAGGDEVHLASTFPCDPALELASMHVIPVAFSGAAGAPAGRRGAGMIRRLTGTAFRTRLRQMVGPRMLSRAAGKLKSVIETLRPDLVHAMRIPFEGMLAARAMQGMEIPLVVSVWGNDFTLHAGSTRGMARETRRTLARVDGLHTDTQRDQKLARKFGYPEGKAGLVLPGGGGIRTEVFFPPPVPQPEPVVINPRGLRTYIRNDTFFKAVPMVLAEIPQARFVCPAMAGEAEALRWVERFGLGEAVELLPHQDREHMGALFRGSQVAVSVSEHDGTPNTLLEAMACGCFPVAGNIESIREWLRDGENGLLVDPGDARSLAAAILRGLREPDLRQAAANTNAALVAERADYRQVMHTAAGFYQAFL